MKIQHLREIYSAHPAAAILTKWEGERQTLPLYIDGLRASAPALFFSALPQTLRVYILGDEEEAGYFYNDMTQALGEDKILFFPSSYRRAIKYGQKDPAGEISRTEVLDALSRGEARSIVTYPAALAEKVVSREDMESDRIMLSRGDEVKVSELSRQLFDLGFQLSDYVYEPGQYAIRGGIVDIYSYSQERPFRLDFFGDEIDSIRTFDVDSQLSREKIECAAIIPEFIRHDITAVPFAQYLPQEAILCFRDYNDVCQKISQISADSVSESAYDAADEEEKAELDVIRRTLMQESEFVIEAEKFRRIEFGHKPSGPTSLNVSMKTQPQPLFHKNFDLVGKSLGELKDKGYRIYICSDSEKQTERLARIFQERGDKVDFIPVDRTLHEGFIDEQTRMAILTDHQIFDRYHKYRVRGEKARSGKAALTLKEIRNFEIGDYVVHIDHGIGKFGGLVRVPDGQTTREVIRILYQNDDVVLVSIHNLQKVSKYRGKDGEAPRLSKLGTGAWEKLKNRTKSKLKDIARDLIKLYARRREEKGFKFSPDSYLQRELEASFIYEDTPDQLKATQDVKADMESPQPMDRLICGDVGFGKTEIAIRAAFKAVADSKQVAVLVPTTVLAFQHYQTFKDRLKEFPANVEYLTRARTAAQTREIRQRLAEGKIDIIIGTQKILGKTMKFKDLGLLIIDEEQKFGVSVKEKLRAMKVNVDTLTLTATPIPRTLQFSLMGARDLSVIQTPPPNRYPIRTEIHTMNPEIIAEAVNFEMSRGGQTFFVNNRVGNLGAIRDMIKKYVPDCRVAVGHGQMSPSELEQIITDFVNYEYDVLVATTIIESGIDIPNANTIIINSAQHFGLSDLHQMRGRVGRSNKKAFCYLLAPPKTALPRQSVRRLEAIENFSDLGSGFHIAMQDLDIRGAGNMLGAEQSGFIADLGYEAYQKVLSEAVRELRDDEFQQLQAQQDMNEDGTRVKGDKFVDDCQIESDLEMLFPESYVPSSSERMALYRELDTLTTDHQLEEYRKRLIDRFGRIPAPGEELLRIVPIRRMAAQLGVEKIFLKAGRMTLHLVSNTSSPYYKSEQFGRIVAYAMHAIRGCILRGQDGKVCPNLLIKNVDSSEKALSILSEISQITPV